MGIDAEKVSFEESFEETDSVGVTFLFPPCFKDDSILSTDDGVTMGRRDDTSRSGSRWGQEGLWEGTRGKGKLTEEGKDKDTGEGGGVRGKDFEGKGYMWKGQSVSNRSSIDSVNIYSIGVPVSVYYIR